jgi:UDP-2-acetamido-3-amino-2,3-dideoxy-glucuronate N-acetyltransferase
MNDYQVHSSSIVDEGAEVGSGTKIWHFSHICAQAKIGNNCSLGQNVFVGNQVIIGNNVKIQNNVSIYDAVILEDDVFCGPSMVFTNVYNPRSHIIRKHQYQRTIVRQGATIGANATIVCGIEIGNYAFIGAGAVVTKDVKPYALIVGVPGHQIGFVCSCGVRLAPTIIKDVTCSACNSSYVIDNDSCVPVN